VHQQSAELATDWAQLLDEVAIDEGRNIESSAPKETTNTAFLVGVALKNERMKETSLTLEESLDELAALASSAGLVVVGRGSQTLERVDGRTYVGSGKLQEFASEALTLGADCLLFNDELRPSQQRNAEGVSDGLRVIDRTALILDIFRQRAATRCAERHVPCAGHLLIT
jgi:GTP-binding protein HflX